MRHRLIFDVSTLARWAGPPVGIIRVERELARWANRHIDHLVFAFFDPFTKSYRELNRRWIDAMVDGRVSVEPWAAPGTRKRRSDRIPQALRPAARWVLQFRRSALLGLERLRLGAGPAWVRRTAERLQHALMTEKYRAYLFNPDGSRRSVIGHDEFAGPPVVFTADDMLVCAGAPWAHSDIRTIAALKKQHGFRFAVLCYDFIPVQFPHFYKEHDAQAFRDYYAVAIPIADLVLFTALVVERDTLAACAQLGMRIAKSRVVPLGADAAPRVLPTTRLPGGLEAGRYALFVSTIEPRKGHRMLTEVWLKLLSEHVPQRHDFTLVFVGRAGWLMDDLIAQWNSDARLGGTLRVFHELPDDALDALYEGAAFCLYPSAYEGFGLPVIEAFLRGKAVLASTGGAIPEVVAGLSPCLDPGDAALWQATLALWISDPGARVPYETAVRGEFRHVPWSEAAARFFATIEDAIAERAELETVEEAVCPTQ